MRAFLLREGDRVRVVTPYVPDFVTDLKEEIPYYAKSWDRESKNWLVDGEYEEAALEVASRYFETTIVVPEAEALRRERAARASATTSTPPPSSQPLHNTDECARRVRHVHHDLAALYLLPGAPWKLIQAAYRAMATLVHPDVAGSGSHQEMVKVNQAYEALEKRHRGATT